VFRYRVTLTDGSDLGEAVYATTINPDEVIHFGRGDRYEVVDVVSPEEDESKYATLLMVEAA